MHRFLKIWKDIQSVQILWDKLLFVDKNDNENDNGLETTPECRAFIAKKLSEMLDRELECCIEEQEAVIAPKDHCTTEGIRLFVGSSNLVTDGSASSHTTVSVVPQRRRKVSSSTSDSSEDERLASVAVTEEFLAKERATLARLHQMSANNTDSAADVRVCVADQGTDANDAGPVSKVKKKKKKQRRSEENSTEKIDTDVGTKSRGKADAGSMSRENGHFEPSREGDDASVAQDRACDGAARKKKCKKKKKKQNGKAGGEGDCFLSGNSDKACSGRSGNAESREWWPADSWPTDNAESGRKSKVRV
nr:hypothetical protein BaRGS_018102 [Batillaria attramentaria]